MHADQQPAYVLHARPYRETSLLLECLTRDFGRLGMVARGVRGERARGRRALLEPFQRLHLSYMQRGELATLGTVEVVGAPCLLTADCSLAGLYLNELVVRLTPRQDAQPRLFDLYAQTLMQLAGDDSVAWTLRRFERDLLAIIGYALPLQTAADGASPLAADGWYVFDPERGATPATAATANAVSGRALIALAGDALPEPSDLRALRQMMRDVIRFHLGGGELRSWRVLAGVHGARRN